MAKHLDVHFLLNRVGSEAGQKRGARLQRRWFDGEDTWLAEREGLDTSDIVLSDPKLLEEQKEAEEEKKIKDVKEALRIQPCVGGDGGRACFVCTQEMPVNWSDDHDEWVFESCLGVHDGGGVYTLCRRGACCDASRAIPVHATCAESLVGELKM